MKLATITFLFFYSFFSSIYATNERAQEQNTDSLRYYYNLANYPKTSSDLPKAYKFYINLKNENLRKKDTLQAVQNFRQIAIMQNNWGDYYASESSAVEALKLLDNFHLNDSTITEAKLGLYNQVGRISHALLKYDSAIDYFNKGLEVASSQEDINIIINNKALVYRDQGNYKQAELEFTKAYKNSLKLNDSVTTSRVLNNLGLVRSKLNHPMALDNLLGALNIRLKYSDVSGSYSSYKNLSIYYSDRDNNDKALSYANMALTAARKTNQASYMEDALSLILNFYKDENVILYKKLKDSLEIAKQIQENKSALLKYNVEEEQRKYQESELQKEVAQRKTLFAQGLLGFVVLFATFLYLILRSRHKKERLQQVYNTEARISKIVHDEVANDVYQVMTKLPDNSAILDDLEHIYSKTRDISKDNSLIELNSSFEETINELLFTYKNESVGVITKGIKTVNWNALSNIKKVTIYRVLQELMTNMKKHSQASIVAISFSKNKNKIHINYKDNGIGCDLKKQVGLQNVENRIASINATIIFDSEPNKGFNVKIVV